MNDEIVIVLNKKTNKRCKKINCVILFSYKVFFSSLGNVHSSHCQNSHKINFLTFLKISKMLGVCHLSSIEWEKVK